MSMEFDLGALAGREFHCIKSSRGGGGGGRKVGAMTSLVDISLNVETEMTDAYPLIFA